MGVDDHCHHIVERDATNLLLVLANDEKTAMRRKVPAVTCDINDPLHGLLLA
jgi:hypothetical protein